MSRDGSGVYHRPPGTDAVPDTTIESSKYNAYVADIEQDLNTPRPIVAGGTGAANAHDAMVALSGEITNQVVTNYDSWPFVSGSFSSAPGATSAPVAGHTFIGYSYGNNANNAQTVEARDLTDGKKYVRNMVGGVWGAWQPQGTGSVADLDAAYVNVAGDIMTGALTAGNAAAAGINITGWDQNGASALNGALWLGNNTGVQGRFRYDTSSAVGVLYLDNTQNNAGANIVLRTTTSGTPKTATLTGSGDFKVDGQITAGFAGSTGFYYFGNSGTKSLSYDGTGFNLVGGKLFTPQVVCSDNIISQLTATTGGYYFGSSGTKYLQYDGTVFNLVGGSLAVNGSLTATGSFQAGGTFQAGNWICSRLSATTGTFYFGDPGPRAITYDGTNYLVYAGGMYLQAGSYGLSATPSVSYNIDGMGNTVTAASGANMAIIQNFSGVIITTCFTTGQTDVFACGGGTATRIGGSAAAATAVSAAPPQQGYVITNISGNSSTFGIITLRGRNTY